MKFLKMSYFLCIIFSLSVAAQDVDFEKNKKLNELKQRVSSPTNFLENNGEAGLTLNDEDDYESMGEVLSGTWPLVFFAGLLGLINN